MKRLTNKSAVAAAAKNEGKKQLEESVFERVPSLSPPSMCGNNKARGEENKTKQRRNSSLCQRGSFVYWRFIIQSTVLACRWRRQRRKSAHADMQLSVSAVSLLLSKGHIQIESCIASIIFRSHRGSSPGVPSTGQAPGMAAVPLFPFRDCSPIGDGDSGGLRDVPWTVQKRALLREPVMFRVGEKQ
ncbi:hypothetical protein BC939DRAFT_433817 [Gamsiella multidivaricata]|uniref:uncharacterized protein n=1 Tax=Gamsiella multidivaricata TaxID=101098 RepID=UPI0022206DF8|nr:uncharacterized protein BC939DRAFT_433817 [Gamsiella multidivaricata]KAI7832600.1 hypothetical protein BC939DRAFT_433817 [Gamsiella multidivaricata]